MLFARLSLLVSILGASVWLLLLPVAPSDPPQVRETPPGTLEARKDPDFKGGYITEMHFPTDRETKETAWKVHWYIQKKDSRENFIIRQAWFKTKPDKDWLQVLGPTCMAEIHVAYASGLRYFDMSQEEFELFEAVPEEAGPNGKILGEERKVVGELRTRGILWKHLNQARRGETMLLWATLQAGNYDYIMEYGFQDEGTITFRMGSTGQNLAARPMEAHMHNGYWRVDIDLGGPSPNDVYVTRHSEVAQMRGQSKDFVDLFNKGVEGFADWDPRSFSKLLIVNPRLKNVHDHYLSYMLMPIRSGTARHFGGKGNIPNENFTHHDFWVTAQHDEEVHFHQVEKYIANRERIEKGNVVLWYMASAHHMPRDEDFVDGQPASALVMWCGFDLRPRNVFDQTPFYP